MNEPSDSRSDILSKLLPGGRGVWIPMDHGLSGYPETGLDRMDSASTHTTLRPAYIYYSAVVLRAVFSNFLN